MTLIYVNTTPIYTPKAKTQNVPRYVKAIFFQRKQSWWFCNVACIDIPWLRTIMSVQGVMKMEKN